MVCGFSSITQQNSQKCSQGASHSRSRYNNLEEAKPQLLTSLHNDNWKIRLKAAYFLALLNDEDSQAALRKLKNDPVMAVALKVERFLNIANKPYQKPDIKQRQQLTSYPLSLYQ